MITYYLIEKKDGNRSVFRTLKDKSEIAILLSPHNPKIPDQHLVEEIKKDGALTIKKKTADIILGEQFRVLGGKSPYMIFDGVGISYVHELQHALKLEKIEMRIIL